MQNFKERVGHYFTGWTVYYKDTHKVPEGKFKISTEVEMNYNE